TAPTVLIGLLLFGTCLVSAWSINRLQTNTSAILTENVTSLEYAQELEIILRKLRFKCYLYLIEPNEKTLGLIREFNTEFRERLPRAEGSADTRVEEAYVRQIKEGYDRYTEAFERMREEVERSGPKRNFGELSEANPINHVVTPCEELLEVNKRMMDQ